MASGIYTIAKSNLMNKLINFETDTFKVVLYDNSHAFTAADVNYTTTNEHATANGYTQGGLTIATTVSAGSPVTTIKFDGADAVWTASGALTAYHAVIIDTSVNATDNNLICSIDFGAVKTATDGTFTIQWDAAGIIALATAV
jgi:hypothetical protein